MVLLCDAEQYQRATGHSSLIHFCEGYLLADSLARFLFYSSPGNEQVTYARRNVDGPPLDNQFLS